MNEPGERAAFRAERFLMARALFLLPVTDLGLRVLGFRRLYAGLARLVAGCCRNRIPAASAMAEAQRVARAVMLTNRQHSFYEARCLAESLTLWWLLRRRGVAADFRIGVRTITGPLQAHAWVEHDGVVLNDVQNISEIFEPFDSSSLTTALTSS